MLQRLDMFPVLDSGHVTYLDHMGSDSAIASDARVSYKGLDATLTEEEYAKDEALIRTLLRSGHSSPFEQSMIKWGMKIPMDVWRQFVRHRTFKYLHPNEYSTRYKPAFDEMLVASEWRTQHSDNKQGSGKPISDDSIIADLAIGEQKLHELSREVYQHRLDVGVAREQARKDLPLSTYTEITVTGDVWNLMNFFMLRRKSDAQLEIREVANCLYENIFKPLFPATAKAFEDYRFNAVSFSAIDIEVLSGRMRLEDIKSKRERDELSIKMDAIQCFK